jgi:hypothetical protein
MSGPRFTPDPDAAEAARLRAVKAEFQALLVLAGLLAAPSQAAVREGQPWAAGWTPRESLLQEPASAYALQGLWVDYFGRLGLTVGRG